MACVNYGGVSVVAGTRAYVVTCRWLGVSRNAFWCVCYPSVFLGIPHRIIEFFNEVIYRGQALCVEAGGDGAQIHMRRHFLRQLLGLRPLFVRIVRLALEAAHITGQQQCSWLHDGVFDGAPLHKKGHIFRNGVEELYFGRVHEFIVRVPVGQQKGTIRQHEQFRGRGRGKEQRVIPRFVLWHALKGSRAAADTLQGGYAVPGAASDVLHVLFAGGLELVHEFHRAQQVRFGRPNVPCGMDGWMERGREGKRGEKGGKGQMKKEGKEKGQ